MLGLGLGVALSRASHADVPPTTPTKTETHQVEFRANHVELDTDATFARPEGRRGDSLRALSPEWGQAGIAARGARRARRRSRRTRTVSVRAPAAGVRLARSRLGTTSDVLLASATLRVFGIPVLWLPYLWLRSPNRAGLMPPFVTYRAEGRTAARQRCPPAARGAAR
ncbi:MAG: hypothetical protein QM756_26840, partial [Polyangiaceae bacterium]